MDQWLVRTAKNRIAGPYSKNQVCDLILQGKLLPKDEVCPANGYWFYLKETKEVSQHLGIKVPVRAGDKEDDSTDTDVSGPEERTDPELEVTAVRKYAPTRAPSASTMRAGVRLPKNNYSHRPIESSESMKSWFALLVTAIGILALLFYYFLGK